MRIAIDAHTIGFRETGNERYTKNLLAGLTRAQSENEYLVLVTDRDALRREIELPPDFEVWRLSPRANVPRVLCAIPAACRAWGAQVLHVSYTAPPICPCPTVVTVHDIGFARVPRMYTLRDRLVLSVTVPMSCRSASRVIAVSQFTKREVAVKYGIAEDKIRVIYEAPEERFSTGVPARLVEQARAVYSSGLPYILAVGSIEPRKNVQLLVDAFATVVAQGVVDRDVVLVIAGKAAPGVEAARRAVARHGLEDRVSFPGYVPDGDLPALYSGAEVLAFPSLYEGFGLPPLEAMACGVPVICSRAASLPEVVGDAALLVPPDDPAALSTALKQVLSDEGLRSALIAAGLSRASRFSWDRAARDTLGVYAEAGRGGLS
jgi:glycosyltransferase involved in cell wall biosynthesis